MWIAAIEGAAWIGDALFGHRAALIEAIDAARPRTDPIPARDPSWPAGALRVRAPDRHGPRANPYRLGGRSIADAWPNAKQDLLFARELEGDVRPRVIVVGGSAALGFPYAYEASFARRLARARPELRVINAGQAAWASGQVLGVARRALRDFAPAALVVYTGNNELFAWRQQDGEGHELERALATSRALAGALWLGHRLRARGDVRREAPLLGWRHALENPAAAFDVRAWRRQREAHAEAFRAHLRAIRDEARARGARVILCTVPFRHRLSPSFHHPQPISAGQRARLSRAAAAIEADPEAALRALDRAIADEPEAAVAHAMRGDALERLERHEDARAAYAQAREHTVGHLGMRLTIDSIVREVAGEDELLDLRALFDARSIDALVEDDCHPTPEGHALIASELAARL
ncbi:MAG: hypothetical protein M5U28_47420 [Sandaracinaceae bacterium]|nr:hypothetical protein [Sandaracinaceae bacterium]